MKYSKQWYKDLKLPNGYKWAFYDNGLHSFIKRNDKGFIETRVNEEDIENGDYLLMMFYGQTR